MDRIALRGQGIEAFKEHRANEPRWPKAGEKKFIEECIKDTDGVLPGKTIFFCSSMSHARRIEKIFDSLYPEYCGELAKVMVSDDPRVYGDCFL